MNINNSSMIEEYFNEFLFFIKEYYKKKLKIESCDILEGKPYKNVKKFYYKKNPQFILYYCPVTQKVEIIDMEYNILDSYDLNFFKEEIEMLAEEMINFLDSRT